MFSRMMRRLSSTRDVLLLGWVLAVAAAAQAQPTTGSIMGTVRDASKAPLAGARITARHLETGLVRAATSGVEGSFVIPALPVGAYEVRAELAGFRPTVRRPVTLALGEPAILTFALDVGAASEEVTVTGELSGVRTRSGELSYLVAEETVRELPLNGRNFTDLAFLQPGVIAFPHRDAGSVVAHGVGASVNGQDPRSNVYLLDGTLMNDFTNGPAGSAAGTTLGTETVREFRIEANAYGAEYGRNSGGQINVITKSGSNAVHGSAYEYHRNDALDARNFFDAEEKPDFRRNQFGFTLGGPARRDRTFFFLGYEGLRDNLGRTVSTVVPDEAARRGVLPDPTGAGRTITVPIDAAVRPYLDEYPLPNGRNLGGGLAAYSFPFDQKIDQDFFQARIDQNLGQRDQFFVRYTFDRADQQLPTDFPQFPRAFVSRNQFLTGEYRRAVSDATMATLRLGWSRTRVAQEVQANTSQPLAPFVAGRRFMGDIDIGGIPRFGPQSSADVNLRQQVFSLGADLVRSQGRHLLKAGVLAERYRDDMENPTFSLGIFTFSNLEAFLRNRPLRFIGLTPQAEFERRWRFNLLAGYLQDEVRIGRKLTLTGGLRYEYQSVPREEKGRDISLPSLTDTTVTVGPLYENPTALDFSPRVGFAWDVFGDGRTALRGGYGLYFNTNNQQNLIVTVTNPPFTPRPVIPNPRFPTPDLSRTGTLSIRPIQTDLDMPRIHVWNVSVQRELPLRTLLTVGYAGARGRHLLRNFDANIPAPQELSDGSLFWPATAVRPNAAFSTIELKASDGDSWYNALVFELRRASVRGLGFQASYTFSRNVDTTQASTFFSDATNGTVSVMPEFGRSYNKGLADYHAKHNLVFNLTWSLPLARNGQGLAKALLADWQIAAIGQYRSGPPLTPFVQANRSRSRWSPSIAPGTGLDRPDLASGRTPESAVRGTPEQWFDPTAFVLQPAGQLGDLGRGAIIGPDLAVLDLALAKRIPWARLGAAGRVELRVEAFNVLNRANFGIPALVAFAGERDGEQPLATFGRIRSTVTAARQVQLGVRVVF
jgi:hypothetical protein